MKNKFIAGFITLLLFGLLVILFNLYFDNINMQLKLNMITLSSYNNKIAFSIFILIFISLLILFVSEYLYNTFTNKSEKDQKIINELEIINNLYNDIQVHKGLKDVSTVSLSILSKLLGVYSGLLYISNFKNQELQLISTWGIKEKDIDKRRDLYRGVIGESISTKKIKFYENKFEITISIPLVCIGIVIGAIELKYPKRKGKIEINNSLNIIIQIISNQISKEIEQEENKKYLDLINENVIVSSTNTEGRITYISDAFCKVTGYDREDLIGKSHSIMRSPKKNNSFYKELWEVISSGKKWTKEVPNINKDGSVFWANTTIYPEYDLYNNIIGYNSIREDITDKKIIEKISITDALTSIYNRRYFDKMLKVSLNLANRFNKILVFCMIDVDNFKKYNDCYGHQKGDDALMKIAQVLAVSLKRENDYVFRLGGEEFGMLYFVDDDSSALNIANKTRQKIEEEKIEHKKNDTSIYVTVSMGLYLLKTERISTDEIYKRADALLYRAKANGRNRVESNKK